MAGRDNLTPAAPGNTLAARNGLRSPRLREPRAQEIAAELMELPHVVPIDEIAARECGAIGAFVEALDAEIARVRMSDSETARLAHLGDLRLRANRRLLASLAEFGATPATRAKWAKDMAQAESLAETIARKRREGGSA